MWKRGWGLTKALHLTAAGQPVVLPGKRLAPAGGGERRRSVPTCISILRLRSPVRDPPLRAWGSRAERPSDDLRRRDGEDDRRGAFGGGRAILLYAVREHQPTLDSAQVGHSEAHPDGVRRGDARTAEPLRHGRRWP